ncbi:mevalonate kinase [Haliangium sp.]|uniref:mevalonate kinase n=1 Tax=Haliangium sp. TaxID=2663208 RepID=UPI003D129E8D
MTWAFGKAILLGEHAVVYGHPALAGAIDSMVRCRFRSRPRGPGLPQALPPLRLRVPAWQLEVVLDGDGSGADDGDTTDRDYAMDDPERALRALIDTVGAHLNLDVRRELGPGELIVDTTLPAAAGLGSSAALSVALVRTLGQCLGHPLADSEVCLLADSAERCFHENPSGVDVALATRGGLGLYYRGHGLEPIAAAPLPLAVGLTGTPRSTAAMVARVAAAWEGDRSRVDAELATLGQAARAGAEAMRHGDSAGLGALMDQAHEVLRGLGVSSPTLDELCGIARRSGAMGAKLTGAGGGGAVIALGPGGTEAGAEAVVAAWREAGYEGMVCRVGVLPAARNRGRV